MLQQYQVILERGFEVLNKVYFSSELEPVVITVQSSPRSNGHFTVAPVWRAEEGRYHEINISAEHLDRPIENIMATLMHEMIHHYCSFYGISETSQSGRYHNKLFKIEAEKRGLIINYKQYIGYSLTTPSKEFIEIIKSNNLDKPIKINRSEIFENSIGGEDKNGLDGLIGVDGLDKRKKKTSTRKYICPCCSNTFRATKDVNVLCMDCNIQFEKDDL